MISPRDRFEVPFIRREWPFCSYNLKSAGKFFSIPVITFMHLDRDCIMLCHVKRLIKQLSFEFE